MAAHGGHMMPSQDGANTRALKIAGWLTGIYFFFELGIGIWTGSIAVLSDAFHTFSANELHPICQRCPHLLQPHANNAGLGT